MGSPQRLVIISGKGGVGKSAVAAARALHGARAGHRVLALSATASPGLAHHLAVAELTDRAAEIEPGLFAANIDLGVAMQEYLQLQLRVPTPRVGMVSAAFEVLANTAPGIREIITIGKAIHEATSGHWDEVIVDGPPTGQLGSYLIAPRTVSELVPTGRIREQSGRMESVLRDPSTHILLVTLLEELPVVESREALAELAGFELAAPPTVIANRVLPALDVPAEVVGRLEDGPVRQAAALHMAVSDSQREWAGQLDVDLLLPHLFGLLTPAEVASRLCELLP